LRQVSKSLWRVEFFGRLTFDVTVEHEEAKKTARRADGPGY